ncbi:MAG: SusC/RagA family TonB-linked outer membrane protein, partial [Sphingobacteriaceae bacterium]
MHCSLLLKRLSVWTALTGFVSLSVGSVYAAETGKPFANPPKLSTAVIAVPVSGTVTDENGASLIGVTVKVKGSGNGITTDVNGKFRITVPDANSTLTFSYVGYTTQDVQLNGRSTLLVQLAKAATSNLNEVLVVGYGTQRRATVTGAISSVSAKTISSLPVAGVDQALQGRVAGLTVVNNGPPGTAAIVTIRGISSISFSSNPLYVVDGFILNGGSLNDYDPKDIENVQVLKDASTAAIYGSRATNGVIIVTTKKGSRDGKVNVSLDSYAGIQSPSKYLDLLNTSQYVQFATALNGTTGLPPRLQAANFNAPIYKGATQTYAQTNTDWQRAYFKSNQLLTGNNLSVSGGNDVSRFYTSGGYFRQNGIAQALDYERYNYRINSDHIISKVFTFG